MFSINDKISSIAPSKGVYGIYLQTTNFKLLIHGGSRKAIYNNLNAQNQVKISFIKEMRDSSKTSRKKKSFICIDTSPFINPSFCWITGHSRDSSIAVDRDIFLENDGFFISLETTVSHNNYAKSCLTSWQKKDPGKPILCKLFDNKGWASRLQLLSLFPELVVEVPWNDLVYDIGLSYYI